MTLRCTKPQEFIEPLQVGENVKKKTTFSDVPFLIIITKVIVENVRAVERNLQAYTFAVQIPNMFPSGNFSLPRKEKYKRSGKRLLSHSRNLFCICVFFSRRSKLKCWESAWEMFKAWPVTFHTHFIKSNNCAGVKCLFCVRRLN